MTRTKCTKSILAWLEHRVWVELGESKKMKGDDNWKVIFNNSQEWRHLSLSDIAALQEERERALTEDTDKFGLLQWFLSEFWLELEMYYWTWPDVRNAYKTILCHLFIWLLNHGKHQLHVYILFVWALLFMRFKNNLGRQWKGFHLLW